MPCASQQLNGAAACRVDELRQQEAAARSAVDEASMQRHKVCCGTFLTNARPYVGAASLWPPASGLDT